VVITERPEAGGGLPRCGADVLWASTATARTAKVVIRITSVFFICLEFLWKYISLDDDRESLITGSPEVRAEKPTSATDLVVVRRENLRTADNSSIDRRTTFSATRSG
jgi:hypothetical protein